MSAYLLGVATPFIVAVVGYWLLCFVSWIAECVSMRTGCKRTKHKWHHHEFPPGLPWWVVHALDRRATRECTKDGCA